MKKILFVGFMVILCAFFGYAQTAPAARPQQAARPAAASAATTATAQRALVDEYCVTCHSDKTKTAVLTLEKLDVAHAAENADVWEKVIRKLRAGMMPPPGVKKPDRTTVDAMAAWLENEIDRVAATKPAYVRPGVHRLNRTEYANAVKDMLALDIDVASMLPVDDSGYGFDNVAGSLNMSTSLLESYVSAAGKISRLALGLDLEPA